MPSGTEIRARDRVLITGKTGSGKTWLAGKLLAPISRLVVIDPKANLTEWNLIEPRAQDWRRLEKGYPVGRFRIVPPVTDNPEAWYEELFERLYAIANVTIYIDEAYAVCPPGSKPGKWLSALYTRGRERKIGVWAATQRPLWIPLFLISEADWLIMFRLNLSDDRKRMSQIMGDEVIDKIPDPHGFWLYGVENDEPEYFPFAVL